MTYTKKPWISQGWVPTWAYIPIESRFGRIAYVMPTSRAGPVSISMKEAEANARLIAAAPELLEALEAAVGMIDEMMLGGLTETGLQYLVDNNLKPARAVIARAKEES